MEFNEQSFTSRFIDKIIFDIFVDFSFGNKLYIFFLLIQIHRENIKYKNATYKNTIQL